MYRIVITVIFITLRMIAKQLYVAKKGQDQITSHERTFKIFRAISYLFSKIKFVWRKITNLNNI